MTRCVTIDSALLEKTKMDKILPRLVKRSDDQGKALAQIVLDNAAQNTREKAIEAKPTLDRLASGEAAVRSLSNGTKPSDMIDSPTKERPVDAKKQSVEGVSKGSNTNIATKPTSTVNETAKNDAKAPRKEPLSAKAAAIQAPAKPSSFFSSLKSASKKPGTASHSKDGKSG